MNTLKNINSNRPFEYKEKTLELHYAYMNVIVAETYVKIFRNSELKEHYQEMLRSRIEHLRNIIIKTYTKKAIDLE